MFCIVNLGKKVKEGKDKKDNVGNDEPDNKPILVLPDGSTSSYDRLCTIFNFWSIKWFKKL